jgi:hypothetical protein
MTNARSPSKFPSRLVRYKRYLAFSDFDNPANNVNSSVGQAIAAKFCRSPNKLAPRLRMRDSSLIPTDRSFGNSQGAKAVQVKNFSIFVAGILSNSRQRTRGRLGEKCVQLSHGDSLKHDTTIGTLSGFIERSEVYSEESSLCPTVPFIIPRLAVVRIQEQRSVSEYSIAHVVDGICPSRNWTRPLVFLMLSIVITRTSKTSKSLSPETSFIWTLAGIL